MLPAFLPCLYQDRSRRENRQGRDLNLRVFGRISPASVLDCAGLSRAQYARLSAAVRRVGATEHPWHLLLYDCNNFAIEVGQALGLRAPSAMSVPRAFIDELRDLNRS